MTTIREVQKACDLYASGKASIEQVARVAGALASREPELRDEIGRLRAQLAKSYERNKALRLRASALMGHVTRLSGVPERSVIATADPPRPEAVYQIVSQVTGVEADALCGRRRQGDVSRARWLGWMAVRRVWPHLSLPAAGRLFDRDHTVILNAERCGAERLKTDPQFAEDLRSIMNLLADLPETQAAE